VTDPPLTIRAFQQHIRERYYETDRARGTPATFMWLIEEVGELATALHGEDRPARPQVGLLGLPSSTRPAPVRSAPAKAEPGA
jgi:NTP pyrophosphatase (non-canonical NTP hydrolase)